MTTFSVWPEATMFAILLANMFAPITDYAIRAWKKKRKQAA
jgi:Na+-translocating ferredoxin:NAD+ oxidoreductase RnfD subunit